jgi:hypothetical protein
MGRDAHDLVQRNEKIVSYSLREAALSRFDRDGTCELNKFE